MTEIKVNTPGETKYYTFEMASESGITEHIMTACNFVDGKMLVSAMDKTGRTLAPFEPCYGMCFTGSVDSIDYWLRR